MSVSEGLSEAEIGGRKPGGVLIFVPLLIAILGAGAIFLGQAANHQAQANQAHAVSGYGIDERITGAISAPADTEGGVITFAR